MRTSLFTSIIHHFTLNKSTKGMKHYMTCWSIDLVFISNEMARKSLDNSLLHRNVEPILKNPYTLFKSIAARKND